MTYEEPDIPGASNVTEWFGRWPTFHDAEVLSIIMQRSGESRVAICAFETTSEVDGSGRYVLAKQAVVTFVLDGFPQDQYGITNTRVEFFNHQNVLSSAAVNRRTEGYELVLEGCHGVDASLLCKHMRVELVPVSS
jgi:hypothetical protein